MKGVIFKAYYTIVYMLINISRKLKVSCFVYMVVPDVSSSLISCMTSSCPPFQVPADSCTFLALIHDFSLDLLSGHDCEGNCRRERGQA